MTTAEFRNVGEALYGSRWQRPLARAIGVSDRWVRRLAAGERQVSDHIEFEALKILYSRRNEMTVLATKLGKRLVH